MRQFNTCVNIYRHTFLPRICLHACASLLCKQVRKRARLSDSAVCFARVHALAVMSRCVCVSITSCSPEEALTPSHGPFLLFLSFFPPLSLLCGSFKVEQKRPGSEMGENERGGVSGALIQGRLCVEMQTGKASALLLLDNYQ